MAKMEVVEAPADVVVTDAAGRKLKIRQPDILDESRLIRAMGDASANQAYMTAYVFPAAMVIEIDANPILFPTSVAQVEALIKRIGRDGLKAVLDHVIAEAEKAVDKEEDLKN